jgi:predicted MPP superfamily phosphohydrolase
MRSGNIYFALTVIVIYFLIDLYVYRGFKNAFNFEPNGWGKRLFFIGFWGLTAFLFSWLIYATLNTNKYYQTQNFKPFYTLMGVLIAVYVPKVVMVLFNLFNDVQHGILLVVEYFKGQNPDEPGEAITRSEFLTRTGIITGGILFSGMLYGISKGKYNYRVIREKLSSPKIPDSFNNFKIVQISDLHLGSFFNDYENVKPGLELINSLNPDIIVFTGDMVNNIAAEAEGWQPYFKNLKAKYGKFSVLGNHDYGDYIKFPSQTEKEKNLERLKEIHHEMGFKLLNNQNHTIQINGQQISLIGVENWGNPPFPQYGDINKALENVPKENYKILLSHDPSHWDAEIIQKTDIDLTLSGHTHGMQFGVEIPGLIKWSPVKYRYPRWGGLYTENNQQLYVNRGFGFIGFPGRVGMPPEITEITLTSSQNNLV